MHFLGHVTNEELTALYDVADLFLCASEHEGFCVPLIEAFYKRVPVLAYAATAVPATMDGGGVLYDTTDPLRVARLMDAVLDDADVEDGGARVAGRGARAAAGARTSPARCCASSTALRAAPPRPRPGGSPGTSGVSSSSSSGSRSCASSGRPFRRCRRSVSGLGLGPERFEPGARSRPTLGPGR